MAHLATGRLVYAARQAVRRARLLVFWALVWALFAPRPAYAGVQVNVKLSGDLVAGGAVTSIEISPDGRYVVFVADKTTDGAFELFSVPIRGSTPPVPLSGVLAPGAKIVSFLITPDSSRVVYRASGADPNVIELYSVPIAGGAPVKLNRPLLGAGFNTSVDFFRLTPDGSQVVYNAPQTTAGKMELYRVPVAGGNPQRLSGAISATADVSVFGISPDGATVAYSVSAGSNTDLYSVPLAGGAAVQLNDPYPGDMTLSSFRFTPDNSRVVYAARDNITYAAALFSVPAQGGAVVPLDSGFVLDVTLQWHFNLSPDSRRVVYPWQAAKNAPFELYSVPVAGGTVAKLNAALKGEAGVGMFVAITPDSSQLVYAAQQDKAGVNELYRVPLGGGVAAKINGPMAGGGVNPLAPIPLTADGARVVYVADQETAGVNEVFTVAINGGPTTKLSGPMAAGGNATSLHMRLAPDEDYVYYRADQEQDGVDELYRVPIEGGTVVKLNGELVEGGDVATWEISPTGFAVVYRADQEVDGRTELFATFERQTLFAPLLRRGS